MFCTIRILLLPLLLLILVGCGVPIGRVITKYDKFNDSTSETVRVGQTVWLTRIDDKKGSPTYGFTISGVTNGNRAMRPNEMVFLLDGEAMRLKGDSSVEDVIVSRYGVLYDELGIFLVQPEQIRRIAQAKVVELRIYGEHDDSPGVQWDRPRIDAVGKFYDLFVERRWDRLSPVEREAVSNALTTK